MSDSRIAQVVAELEEARKQAARLTATLDDARTLIADMVDNSSGLKPFSAYYLHGVLGSLNVFIQDVQRGALGAEQSIEWLQKLPEAKAS